MKSREVFSFLKRVPKGRVTTYGQLAWKAGTSPRAVGQIMRNNKHPDRFPCYKVVCSDGRLGGFTHPKGVREKIRRLERDGIKVLDGRIDLGRYLWKG